MAVVKNNPTEADVNGFYLALSRLLRNYQFRDRDRETICGISATQCYALDFVVHDGRMTVLELGSRLALNKSNASRVVDALESVGAAVRARDPHNHRIRWVEPTTYGRELHGRITGALKQEYQQILKPFGRPFVRKVTKLLDALARRASLASGAETRSSQGVSRRTAGRAKTPQVRPAAR
jgi:MarR family transcriptional regulator, 2-MHQ and catechol-resistance regulon repressor